MKEQDTTNETMDNLMALYDVWIKEREEEISLITTTFLFYCEDHVRDDGFEEDAAPFLLTLYERKEALKALRKERDVLCGIE